MHNHIILCFILFFCVFSQKRDSFNFTYTLAYNKEKELSELVVSTTIPYDFLLFEKEKGGFKASYYVELRIENSEEEVIWSSIKEKNVILKRFDETNSRKEEAILSFKTHLLQGYYKINARLYDKKSKKLFTKKNEIEASQIKKSKISIIDVQVNEILKDSIFPQPNPLIFLKDSGKIRVRFSILNSEKKSNIMTVLMMFLNDEKKIIFQKKYKNTKLMGEKVRNFVTDIEKKIFTSGEQFLLKIEVFDREENQLNFRTQSIYFSWVWYPQTVEEMNLALKKMSYILSPDSINFYQNKPLKESSRFFDSFWQRITKDGSKNRGYHLMKEYFKRVRKAILYFSNYGKNGWKTDRGRIYIKFGNPDDVLSYPESRNRKPYIIWVYYRLKKRFTFIDENGFNDYRLDRNSRLVEYN